jgi:XrtJ-associated TM-motif-TM protein
MVKFGFRCLYLAFVLLAALPLCAQSGCVDSPENPTALLALVGVAGTFYTPLKRKLISVWRNRQDS